MIPTLTLFEPIAGVRLGLFTPDQAFDVVAKKQIEMLKTPSLKLIDLVSEELSKVVQGAVSKVLGWKKALPMEPWLLIRTFNGY